MKLSDAIEAGWQKVPKIEGRYQDWSFAVQDITGACAIGAACYAVRPDETISSLKYAVEIFPELREWIQLEKEGQYRYSGPLGNFVSRLNDNIILDGFAALDPAPSPAEIVAAVRQLGY